jgi:hypothetical protein
VLVINNANIQIAGCFSRIATLIPPALLGLVARASFLEVLF